MDDLLDTLSGSNSNSSGSSSSSSSSRSRQMKLNQVEYCEESRCFDDGVSGSNAFNERTLLRSRYLAMKNATKVNREDFARGDSDKFKSLLNEVENLHQLVQKPREQVADAEALLDIANALLSQIKMCSTGGITPSEFIRCILRDFGASHGTISKGENGASSIAWMDIGLAASHVFTRAPGCCTMNGHMEANFEMTDRKTRSYRKHVRSKNTEKPQELADRTEEKATASTDTNMLTMFNILKKHRIVRLEYLVLNRNSFPQTVENLFTLSFLVKEGRAEISLDEAGHHLVSPRNAPPASTVLSKEVAYSHFIFRFDFQDWKLMVSTVDSGKELMPHRDQLATAIATSTSTNSNSIKQEHS